MFDAIVLRRVDVGEADRIASLLREDGARVEARLPQARKSRKRFGCVDLFATIRAEPEPGRPFRLRGAELLRRREGLTRDVVRLALAGRVAELLDATAREEHAVPDLHRLAEVALDTIADGAADADPRGFAVAFELKLAHVLGVRPALTRCAVCSQPMDGHGAFSCAAGGAVHRGCAPADAVSLEEPVRAALERALHEPLRAQQGGFPRDGGTLVEAWTDAHVARRLRARNVLAELLGALLIAMLPGCRDVTPPDAVSVQGYLFESAAPEEGDRPLPGAEGVAVDEGGDVLAEAEEPYSDAPGWYRFAELPKRSAVSLHMAPGRHDADHVATVVTGRTGAWDLIVDAGTLHLFRRDEVEGWLTDHEGAFGVRIARFSPDREDGALLRGALAEPEAHPGTRVFVRDAAREQEVAYLGEDGVPADGTGERGAFFAWGIEPGPIVLRFEAPGQLAASFVSFAAEDAVTSVIGASLRLD